jgi:acyl-CoA reductase-like NAD-dependent aldehyde dehydrogenase
MPSQVQFPPAPEPIAPTPMSELDAAIARLKKNRASWAALPLEKRIPLLDEVGRRLLDVAAEWSELDARAKGLWPGSPAAGEASLSGPVPTIRNVRLLADALRQVKEHGAPLLPEGAFSTRPDGRLVVKVFPYDTWDRLTFLGLSAEVWMQPGITRENLRQHQAATYRQQHADGKVALVLGAGNQSSIPAMDAIDKLFAQREVVLLKMNPVNDYLGPVFRRMFQPLVDQGWMEIVYGGADVGAYLVQHVEVDNVHITGSDQTHDAIVWGPKEGRAERKARGEKLLSKEISSELGNVTPIVIVPGPWSDREIAYQAESVAAMVANNASFNCIAGKVLVTARDWDRRDAFLAAVRKALAAIPPRKAYYPGARDRWKVFLEKHKHAEVLGLDHEHVVPWTLIPGLDHQSADDPAFRMEPFCGVLHEVPIPGKHATDFLPRAVTFCNERLWGTLGANVIVHPQTRKDPSSEAAFQEALDDLRYGSIAVNHWVGVAYGIVNTPWGAYPGHSLDDIQSGRGFVHNTFLFDRPEKSVLYADFVPLLKPVWFWSHSRVHKLAPPLTRFQAEPSVLKLLNVFPYAMG